MKGRLLMRAELSEKRSRSEIAKVMIKGDILELSFKVVDSPRRMARQ
jgi:hypothetical protein